MISHLPFRQYAELGVAKRCFKFMEVERFFQRSGNELQVGSIF